MAPITYRITPADPHGHMFRVVLTIPRPAAQQKLWLPVWIPGSYLVREFARHITRIEARVGALDVATTKIDKAAWVLSTTGQEESVTVTTWVYAWDLSVRAAHLDASHAFFNGTSVFLAVAGREREPHAVVIEPPPPEVVQTPWRVFTTLPAADTDAAGFGGHLAPDYDTLVDHPVEMGTPELIEWESGGVPHAMAITGRLRPGLLDKERLARDLKAICDAQIRMFHGDGHGAGRGDGHGDGHGDGKPPFARYLFLTMAVGDGYGGLEHKDSTALVCKRDDLPTVGMDEPTDGYRGLLGLCSHEYFHLWNVKRIKPRAFVPYDLSTENYTRLLWAFEGITSYYDDLFLIRSGVISEKSWLDLLGRTTTRVLRWKGRDTQSLADSSFDTWIKYYRQDENTPNSQVSYYTKGSLVALALDLTIRDATDDARSLDDVMRLLWQRHGKDESGVPEDGVERAASEVAGVDLTPFFDTYVRGTEDVPLAGLLPPFGIAAHTRPLESDSDPGGKPGKPKLAEAASLGVTLGSGGDGATLAVVKRDGAAHRAGLSAGDVVIAVDGLKATRQNLLRLVQQRHPGERLRVHAFRRDELMELDVTLGVPEHEAAWFELLADAEAAATARRAAWLGL